MAEKVVLAYSGGLDTSIIIPWLKENYAYDVIAMVGDVGQGDDIEAVVEKAYKTGASKVVVEDMREEFLTGYVFPALRAGAVYEHKYLLGTSLARPVIAKHQVEVALREGATAVAHGCTGKGNDQVRFELAYQALAPELKVIAPWREWTLKSREDCLDYAEKRGISVTASREKIHSRDRNLWHISHEGGELEDAGNAPLPSTWQLTRSPQEAPDREEQVVIGFEKGTPVSVNGMKLDPVSLVELLNEIGGRNAIGRIDLVENRFVGIKSRGCYETPGGTLLIAAHRELEALCLERDLMHFKQHIGLKYAELAYFGLWFTPLREALDAFVDNTQQDITGTTTLCLVQGQRVGGQPSLREFALPYRSLVLHHGRQLRPERCGRIHPHPGAAVALARPSPRRRREARGDTIRGTDEDVVGTIPPAARCRLRALAAVVRLRPALAAGRAGGQPRPCVRAEECRNPVFERTDHHSSGPEADWRKGRGVPGISRRRRSRRRASLRRKAAGRADWRHGIQAAQRPQPQRADCDRPASLRSGFRSTRYAPIWRSG